MVNWFLSFWKFNDTDSAQLQESEEDATNFDDDFAEYDDMFSEIDYDTISQKNFDGFSFVKSDFKYP